MRHGCAVLGARSTLVDAAVVAGNSDGAIAAAEHLPSVEEPLNRGDAV